jgi:flavoprotein
MAKLHTPRWAWVLTGSGHFFTESFALIHELEHCDIFVSKVYPRRIDLEHTERLKSFERTKVMESLADLEVAIRGRRAEFAGHG